MPSSSRRGGAIRTRGLQAEVLKREVRPVAWDVTSLDDQLIQLSVGFEELAQLFSQRCERVFDGERLDGEYAASDEPIANELLERP